MQQVYNVYSVNRFMQEKSLSSIYQNVVIQ